MNRIQQLVGREILDSRGRPTVEATCILESGDIGTCSVPSGASTGSAEAVELRDRDAARYEGLGCRKAASNISLEINSATRNRSFANQDEFDHFLIEIDGTPQKSRLGSNAILASSIALARAVAAQQRIPLYRHFANMAELRLASLPQLTVNLFSGGIHAGGQVPIQDVLLVPIAAQTIDESLSMVASVYQSAARLIKHKYGMRLLRADEGGMAPTFPHAESMLEDSVEAISLAGWKPGADIVLAVDVAASHFFTNGNYQFGSDLLSSTQLIERLEKWVHNYPIISLEDALAEDDWAHWPELVERFGKRIQIMGDDFFCTNPERIVKGIECRAANALLLKVNQIGTLTEAVKAMKLARSVDWRITVSARSGETEDHWLADLAVGWCGDQIKVGSVTQSERLSKYNRLLAIEAETRLPIHS